MRCPICRKEFVSDETTAMPFCSERCRSIDLGRWLDESYGMPNLTDPEADERPDPEPDDVPTNGEPHDE